MRPRPVAASFFPNIQPGAVDAPPVGDIHTVAAQIERDTSLLQIVHHDLLVVAVGGRGSCRAVHRGPRTCCREADSAIRLQ